MRFTPPTVDDVKTFCTSAGLAIDAERFVAYYTGNGWMVGKVKMRDWQATVRSWALRDAAPSAGKGGKVLEQQQYTQREYKHSEAALDAMMDEFMAGGGE